MSSKPTLSPAPVLQCPGAAGNKKGFFSCLTGRIPARSGSEGTSGSAQCHPVPWAGTLSTSQVLQTPSSVALEPIWHVPCAFCHPSAIPTGILELSVTPAPAKGGWSPKGQRALEGALPPAGSATRSVPTPCRHHAKIPPRAARRSSKIR